MQKTTHVYKTVANDPPFTGTTQVHADVYRPDDDQPRPVLVFIHGGGLISGSRTLFKFEPTKLVEQDGYVLVSLDYRLGPEVKVPQIVEDMYDAMRWIHEQGPTLFAADPGKLVILGSSAGGYLAQQVSTSDRKPNAVVSLWGYSSLLNDWYTKPTPPYTDRDIDGDEALAKVGSKVFTTAYKDLQRMQYYYWLRKHGHWTREMTGLDPLTQRDQIAEFCPIEHFTADCPPMLLIHGEMDSDVPVSESHATAAALERLGVEHELVVVPGGEHTLRNLDASALDVQVQRAHAYIRKHLGSAPAIS